jgi:TorA maturation chaperone TorD
MNLGGERDERSEAYRILADLYSKPPEGERLSEIKEDLELKSAEDADAIRTDFNFLFVYPGGRVPPLESLFLARAGTPTGSPAADFYAEADLAIEDESGLLPDHISLEFLFMSYLIDIGNIDLQGRFLEQHLMNWVPYYCGEVKGEAKTLFYKEIAGITADFLGSEYENFE